MDKRLLNHLVGENIANLINCLPEDQHERAVLIVKDQINNYTTNNLHVDPSVFASTVKKYVVGFNNIEYNMLTDTLEISYKYQITYFVKDDHDAKRFEDGFNVSEKRDVADEHYCIEVSRLVNTVITINFTEDHFKYGFECDGLCCVHP